MERLGFEVELSEVFLHRVFCQNSLYLPILLSLKSKTARDSKADKLSPRSSVILLLPRYSSYQKNKIKYVEMLYTQEHPTKLFHKISVPRDTLCWQGSIFIVIGDLKIPLFRLTARDRTPCFFIFGND